MEVDSTHFSELKNRKRICTQIYKGSYFGISLELEVKQKKKSKNPHLQFS